MQKTKLLILFLSAALLGGALISCTDKNTITPENEDTKPITVADPDQCEKEFAQILSKSIYDSEPLRVFLKKEALLQFDNDFDVLYGLVKDKEVSSNATFRDIILSYCDTESQLEEIENTLPLLTILVPDATWLASGGFSAQNWDTADNEIVVTYRSEKDHYEYFGNGDLVCELPAEQIPAFPFLIVKNNERVISHVNTKSGGMTYEFINEVYNGVRTKGGTHNYSGVAIPTLVGDSPIVTAAQLRQVSPIAYNAYNEFGANSSIACQRDYCYYKMTNNNLTNGVLQKNAYEKLYRFKFNFDNVNSFCDDTGDPKLNNIDSIAYYFKGDNTIEEHTPDEVSLLGNIAMNMQFFTDGNLEIIVNCIYQIAPGQSVQQPFYFTVQPCELFEFNKVQFHYLHASFWRKAKYTYVFEKKNIVPKWYYPKNDIYFFNWGIGTKATNYYLEYMEKDSGDTITTTDSYSFTFSTNITGQVGAKEVKYSTGIGTTSTGTQQISTTHQEQSELLSRVIINYSEDVVLNRTINSLDTLFTLRHYDNNAISVCIVPAEMY